MIPHSWRGVDKQNVHVLLDGASSRICCPRSRELSTCTAQPNLDQTLQNNHIVRRMRDGAQKSFTARPPAGQLQFPLLQLQYIHSQASSRRLLRDTDIHQQTNTLNEKRTILPEDTHQSEFRDNHQTAPTAPKDSFKNKFTQRSPIGEKKN